MLGISKELRLSSNFENFKLSLEFSFIKQAREIEEKSGTVWHILLQCRARTLIGTVAWLFNPTTVHCTLVVHLTHS